MCPAWPPTTARAASSKSWAGPPAGTALARRSEKDAPHIILSPEILFNEEAFLKRVKEVVDALGCCVVVVSEGLKNAAGEEIAADRSRLDAFGHPVLSGAAEHLSDLV